MKEKYEGSGERDTGISCTCIFSALPLLPDLESIGPVRTCRCLHAADASNTEEDNDVMGTVLTV